MQLKVHVTNDPIERCQRSLPPFFFQTVYNRATTAFQAVISEVIIVGLLFAMRSCEFCTATGTRKTKIATLDCVRFTCKDNSTIAHDDDETFIAFVVSIEFVDPKNGEYMERTTNKNDGNLTLNSVRVQASIVRHLRNYPDASDSADV